MKSNPADTETLARELLAACEAYHDAVDILFAMLVVRTKDEKPHFFYPSQSGRPWDAAVSGKALIDRARIALGPLMDTHNLICVFGRHKGERYTRLPVSYLKWLANTPTHHAHEIAKAELGRRGTATPTIDISGHAIDSASLRCRKRWHETRGPDEGLHAWLCRVAQEALEKGEADGDRRTWIGIQFVFELEGIWPVLKTVMLAKEGKSA